MKKEYSLTFDVSKANIVMIVYLIASFACIFLPVYRVGTIGYSRPITGSMVLVKGFSLGWLYLLVIVVALMIEVLKQANWLAKLSTIVTPVALSICFILLAQSSRIRYAGRMSFWVWTVVGLHLASLLILVSFRQKRH